MKGASVSRCDGNGHGTLVPVIMVSGKEVVIKLEGASGER